MSNGRLAKVAPVRFQQCFPPGSLNQRCLDTDETGYCVFAAPLHLYTWLGATIWSGCLHSRLTVDPQLLVLLLPSLGLYDRDKLSTGAKFSRLRKQPGSECLDALSNEASRKSACHDNKQWYEHFIMRAWTTAFRYWRSNQDSQRPLAKIMEYSPFRFYPLCL